MKTRCIDCGDAVSPAAKYPARCKPCLEKLHQAQQEMQKRALSNLCPRCKQRKRDEGDDMCNVCESEKLAASAQAQARPIPGMMHEDRVKDYLVLNCHVADILTGQARLVDLPKDARMVQICPAERYRAVAFRFRSASFPRVGPKDQVPDVFAQIRGEHQASNNIVEAHRHVRAALEHLDAEAAER